jgi:tetratricopeptide (TPR) repeat protein
LRSLLAQPEQIQSDPKIKASVLAMKADLNDYLTANGDQAGAHILWAQYQLALGQVKDAITAYQTAIELQPELTGSRSALAQLKENAGEHEAAKKLRIEEMDLLRRDLRLAPHRSDIWYRLGLMSYILKDEEGTLRSMNRVLSLEPNHYNAGIFVIQLNERKGKWSEVKRAAMQLLEHYPQDGYLRQMVQKAMQQTK